MEDSNFKDPFNFGYLLGFLAVLTMPTLPAIIAWIQIFSR